MDELGSIAPRRLTGVEEFHVGGRPTGVTLLDYWQWAASDLVSNTQRGVIAEFLVAVALGIAVDGVREEWAAFDLRGPDGTKIEVKSSAYVQRWKQDKLTSIKFVCPKSRAWDAHTGVMETEARRQADVYVFALHAHTDQATLDTLDVSQWEFYAVPTSVLDDRTRSQHSITLRSLRDLAGEAVQFAELADAISDAAAKQRRTVR